MTRGKIWTGLGAIATLLIASLPAAGADLLSVYDQALVNDPQIREAEALRLAQREAKPQALASLLPQVSASANKGRNWSDGTGYQQFTFIDPVTGQAVVQTTGSGGSNINTSQGWNLQVRQNVFSWQNWMALQSASSQVAQAEADYLAQEQSLVQRVAQQYFAVLNAQDNVEAQEAARNAISRQLEQAEQRFEVGLIAITDVQEARAERDNAAAQVIAAKRSLSSAEEQLRATIGEKPAGLSKPAEDMPLLTPDPASEEEWVRIAMEQNLSLVSSRLAAEIARTNVRSTFGGHLPTVDLVAGRSYTDSSGKRDQVGQVALSASETDGKSLTLQFSLPIYSGGATQSRVRQSQQNWIAAKERLERASRNTERQTRDAYLGVISEMARVQALKQALESSRTALAATEAGYEVGTRTAVDVLTSRRLLILAQTNYSSARYAYLNNIIQLRMASGDLGRNTLEEINRWLTVAPTQ